jgi:ferrochelatase
MSSYDALLVVSFGGPDGPGDVIPFLENVVRGRNVPRERLLDVAEHYHHFGGRSPINEQNRALVAAIEHELAEYGPPLKVYWGNRNWHPLLPAALKQMESDGIRRALALVTSAFSSFSSCRQYREDVAAAQAEAGPAAPPVDKLRAFFNHPGFIEPMVERTLDALVQIPADRRRHARLVFTAHSIPRAMADNCPYEAQLHESCRLVAEGVANSLSLGKMAADWDLVYQSRSGPPQQSWLEPDIKDFLRAEHSQQPIQDAAIVPIGFTSDHLEVVYDLDFEARQLCAELAIHMVRAATVGTHPRFIRMIRELIDERMTDSPTRLALGSMGPSHDNCPDDCCLYTAQIAGPTRGPKRQQ